MWCYTRRCGLNSMTMLEQCYCLVYVNCLTTMTTCFNYDDDVGTVRLPSLLRRWWCWWSYLALCCIPLIGSCISCFDWMSLMHSFAFLWRWPENYGKHDVALFGKWRGASAHMPYLAFIKTRVLPYWYHMHCVESVTLHNYLIDTWWWRVWYLMTMMYFIHDEWRCIC